MINQRGRGLQLIRVGDDEIKNSEDNRGKQLSYEYLLP